MGLTLVTGASGFVGAHLLQEMRKRGLPVRGVSRQKKPGLVTVPSYGPGVDWSEYLTDVEAVIHLAARVHVMQETAKDPLAEFRVANVDNTLNLARQAADAGVRRFIFVSTIKVNGESTEPGKPFTANDAPNPQDPYAVSKAEAEVALLDLGREAGMEITIVRLPLIYGPDVRGNLRRLMGLARLGLPSPFLAVKNKRSLVNVNNVADLLITAIDHPAAINQTFLVSDTALSTHELLCALGARAGCRIIGIPIPSKLILTLATLLRRRSSAERLIMSLEIDPRATYHTLSWRPTEPILTFPPAEKPH